MIERRVGAGRDPTGFVGFWQSLREGPRAMVRRGSKNKSPRGLLTQGGGRVAHRRSAVRRSPGASCATRRPLLRRRLSALACSERDERPGMRLLSVPPHRLRADSSTRLRTGLRGHEHLSKVGKRYTPYSCSENSRGTNPHVDQFCGTSL